MKIKTADLIGPALDWAVAKCVGVGKLNYSDAVGRISTLRNAVMVWSMELPGVGNGDKFSPSADWSQGGPIIEREEIGLKRNAPCSQGREWEASPSITAKGAGGKWGYGPTPLVAAMRCYVASFIGEWVEVPDELV